MVRAKQDEKRRPEAVELTSAQEIALLALVAGASVSDAAEAASVARQTVSTWLHSDAVFVAEVNKRRGEIWHGFADRLRLVVGQALDVLQADLESDDPAARRAAAGLVLKLVKGVDLAPSGDVTAERVELSWWQARHVSPFAMLDVL